MYTIKEKIKILREFNYYFLILPFYSLFPSYSVYEKLSFWVQRKGVDLERKTRVIKNLKLIFGSSLTDERTELIAKRYFSILACDDMDAYLQLFKPWKEIRKFIKIEGEEIFKATAKKGKGCVLLSAHYGGAFFIFNIVKELGGKPQVLGRPIKREYFRGNPGRWAFLKLRVFSMERSLEERMIFTESRETRSKILDKLEKGYHILITFDVPPSFTKGKVGEMCCLGRKWYFPIGFLELLVGENFAIIPFFTHINEKWERIFQFFPSFYLENEGDIIIGLQKCIDIFEKYLLERPEQWFFWDDAQVFWERPTRE